MFSSCLKISQGHTPLLTLVLLMRRSFSSKSKKKKKKDSVRKQLMQIAFMGMNLSRSMRKEKYFCLSKITGSQTG